MLLYPKHDTREEQTCNAQATTKTLLVQSRSMTLYDQSRAHFLKELDGIWFDHIPDALKIEWESCIRALEQSSHYKNPLFILELSLHQQSINGETSSYFAWQRMDDAMKVFLFTLSN
ncbi:hypothetical protein KIW84_062302 [Lathyrus oleraceus]|uniref:Uncharacterized protein n=1 Tax=Pisum sativum TaxID=3888 RepID=A0A9D4W634_PEA|nr:hypothetical protein KIW84_062302 [Pisum sativum]